MTTVGILNVTGYAGAELARLLHGHPEVTMAAVTGRSAAGKRLPEVFPHLWPLDLPIADDLDAASLDVVFSALPHAAAAAQLAPLIEAGVPVIDVSADFRLKRVEEYEAAYKVTHPAPQLLQRAVFGMPELHRERCRARSSSPRPDATRAASFSRWHRCSRRVSSSRSVIADTKTGLSGAGRGLGLNVHFSEADENVAPYALDGHRHLPEMTQELGALAEAPAAADHVRAALHPDDARHPQHLLCHPAKRRRAHAREPDADLLRLLRWCQPPCLVTLTHSPVPPLKLWKPASVTEANASKCGITRTK